MPDPGPGVVAQPQTEPSRSGPENLLVCLSPSPFSIPLIRATKRLADAQQARWYALYVEIPLT